MRNKAIMVSIIALFAIVFALNTVLASDIVKDIEVEVNGVDAFETSPAVAGVVSDTVPIEVQFTANEDVSDVRVRVYIEGYREDIYESSSRFHILNGSRYIERFSLKFPASMDLDDLHETATLYVKISAKGQSSIEKKYAIELQKELYSLNILSVDAPETASAGSILTLDVVLQNNGNERLNDVYVKASIPGLGVERRVYFGDLGSNEESDDLYNENIRNTVNKKLYLNLPRNAAAGVYNLEIEAYNYDASTVSKEKIVISEVETGVLPSSTSETVAIGKEATFDLTLVNPNDRMVVYTLMPQASKGLIVDVSEPVVTVGADSSKTVKVYVKATESAEEGTHLITVDVNSETGLVKKVNFNLNVEKATSKLPVTGQSGNVVLILTIILVIVFAVLLVILIVLLTRKPAETEEFGETSYY